MNKKGSLLDTIFIMVVLLVLGISILLAAYLSDAIFPVIEPLLNDTTATQIIDTAEAGIGGLDILFVTIYILLNLTPAILAFFVDTHPIFIIVNIIIFLVVFTVTPAISNAMQTLWSLDAFSQYAAGGGGTYDFSLMQAIFQYLPYLSLIFMVIVMVAMFVGKGGEK